MRIRNVYLSILFVGLSSLAYSQQVGVNVISPSAEMHVHDSTGVTSLLLSQGATATLGLRLTQTSSESTLSSEKGDLQIKAGLGISTATELKLFKNGHIGIGKNPTSATNYLHIKGTDPLRLEGLTENVSTDSMLVVDGDGVIHWSEIPSGGGGSYWTKSGNKLYTLNDSVGIGRIPTTAFDLYDVPDMTAKFTSVLGNSTLKFVTLSNKFEIGQYSGSETGTALNGTVNKSSFAYLRVPPSTILDDQKGFLLNVEADKPIIFGTDDEERMRIDSIGNIGIGTSTPTQDLHINGSTLVTDTMYIGDQDGYIYRQGINLNLQSKANLIMRSNIGYDLSLRSGSLSIAHFDGLSKNVGLSTITPRRTLDIAGSVILNDSLFINDFNNKILVNTANEMEIVTSDNLLVNSGSGKDIIVKSGSNQIAVFDGSAASMGIGILAPTEVLDVNGTIKSTGLKVVTGNVATHVSKVTTSTHLLGGLEHIVIVTSPGAAIDLPEAILCPGREYILKFLGPGASINTIMPSDLIEGIAPTFIVPPASSPGIAGTTISIVSDGINTWWITSVDI